MSSTKYFVAIAVLLSLAACSAPAAVLPAAQPTPVPAVQATTAPAPVEASTSGPITCPKTGGELVPFISSDPGSLDPAVIANWDQTITAPNFVEGLLRLSPDGQTIEPGLAETMQVSPDGLTWTFKLRDAKFHDGTTVTADDFKFSFERVLNPATKSPKAWMLQNIAGSEDFTSGKATQVSGIKVADPQTLEITISKPMAAFKSMLVSPNLAVVSKAAVEKSGADFGQQIVTAGPFKLGTWNLNQDLTGTAFTDYWNGRPCLDSIKWRVIQDENTRIVEYDAGALDITWVPPAHWDRFNDNPDTQKLLNWARTFHTEFWAFNSDREPFGKNAVLRQALCYAMDREAVVASLQGRAAAAGTILSPGLLGYNKDSQACPHDVAKAKALMTEAGFPNGLPNAIDVILPPWDNEVKLHEIYQANLKDIGVNINLKPTEFAQYQEQLNKGDFDIAWIYRVPDYADPDGFYYPLLHSTSVDGGGNIARVKDPEIDKLIEDGRASLDDAQRIKDYQNIEASVAKSLPYLPLFHNIDVDIRQPYVMNYVDSPMDMHMYQRVWLDK